MSALASAHLVHKLARKLRALARREQHGGHNGQVYRHKRTQAERARNVVTWRHARRKEWWPRGGRVGAFSAQAAKRTVRNKAQKSTTHPCLGGAPTQPRSWRAKDPHQRHPLARPAALPLPQRRHRSAGYCPARQAPQSAPSGRQRWPDPTASSATHRTRPQAQAAAATRAATQTASPRCRARRWPWRGAAAIRRESLGTENKCSAAQARARA